jgi:hypothetical protein
MTKMLQKICFTATFGGFDDLVGYNRQEIKYN